MAFQGQGVGQGNAFQIGVDPQGAPAEIIYGYGPHGKFQSSLRRFSTLTSQVALPQQDDFFPRAIPVSARTPPLRKSILSVTTPMQDWPFQAQVWGFNAKTPPLPRSMQRWSAPSLPGEQLAPQAWAARQVTPPLRISRAGVFTPMQDWPFSAAAWGANVASTRPPVSSASYIPGFDQEQFLPQPWPVLQASALPRRSAIFNVPATPDPNPPIVLDVMAWTGLARSIRPAESALRAGPPIFEPGSTFIADRAYLALQVSTRPARTTAKAGPPTIDPSGTFIVERAYLTLQASRLALRTALNAGPPTYDPTPPAPPDVNLGWMVRQSTTQRRTPPIIAVSWPLRDPLPPSQIGPRRTLLRNRHYGGPRSIWKGDQ